MDWSSFASATVAQLRYTWRERPIKLAFVALAASSGLLYLVPALLYSRPDATVGGAYSAPRLLVSQWGGYLLWTALAAVTVLAADSRNLVEAVPGIDDVVHARPTSNLVLVAAKVAALVVAVWFALVMSLAVVCGLAFAADFGSRGVVGPEPVSLATFAVVDALAAWAAAAAALEHALRRRAVALLSGLTILGCVAWTVPLVPVHLYDALVPVSNRGFASEIAPIGELSKMLPAGRGQERDFLDRALAPRD